jgi:hypothetical protein
MVRSIVGMLFVMLAVAVPVSADIQYCIGSISCQYLVNEAFSTTDAWVYTGTSARTSVTDACGTGSTYAARLANGYTAYQEFYAEPIGGGAHQWSYRFDTYFGSSGGGIYDQLKVEVKDLDTGTVETKIINAGQYGTCASVVSENLSHDYTGHDVRITFTKGGLASMTIDVDNVSFWASPAP